MNPKIKSLIVQAITEIGPEDNPSKEQTLVRFAELIIKECANTAAMFSIENKRIHPDIDPRDMPSANQMVYHSTCQAVAHTIKEYFGLEI
jgi:hypothetical protein